MNFSCSHNNVKYIFFKKRGHCSSNNFRFTNEVFWPWWKCAFNKKRTCDWSIKLALHLSLHAHTHARTHFLFLHLLRPCDGMTRPSEDWTWSKTLIPQAKNITWPLNLDLFLCSPSSNPTNIYCMEVKKPNKSESLMNFHGLSRNIVVWRPCLCWYNTITTLALGRAHTRTWTQPRLFLAVTRPAKRMI